MADSAEAIAAVLGEWKENQTLCKLAVAKTMAVVDEKNTITRQEVCANAKVLEPIVKHLGYSFLT